MKKIGVSDAVEFAFLYDTEIPKISIDSYRYDADIHYLKEFQVLIMKRILIKFSLYMKTDPSPAVKELKGICQWFI